MKKFVFFLVIIFISGCATYQKSIVKPDTSLSTEQQRNTLLGKWSGEMTSDKGELQKWLVERAGDGSYKITFRLYSSETDYKEQIEVGFWGVAGPVYFSIMKGWIKDDKFIEADPTKAYFYDAYRIISLNETLMTVPSQRRMKIAESL